MSNNLLKQRFENSTVKTVAPVIRIWPKRTDNKERKRLSKKRVARKVSILFYTEPIFKSKEHDFL
jgi:hypothetical protein